MGVCAFGGATQILWFARSPAGLHSRRGQALGAVCKGGVLVNLAVQ